MHSVTRRKRWPQWATSLVGTHEKIVACSLPFGQEACFVAVEKLPQNLLFPPKELPRIVF